MKKAQLNISEVAKLTGKSRSTIYQDIKQGLISYQKTGRNKTIFEIAEIIRVYGNIDLNRLNTPTETPKNQAKTPQKREESNKDLLLDYKLSEQENAHLKLSINDKEKEIERLQELVKEQERQLQSERDYQKTLHNQLYETQQQTQRLLEDKRKKGLFGRLWGG